MSHKRKLPDADILAALDFPVRCDLPAAFHDKHGTGQATWLIYVEACEHTDRMRLMCRGCLMSLLDPGSVVLTSPRCPHGRVRYEPASTWILTSRLIDTAGGQ